MRRLHAGLVMASIALAWTPGVARADTATINADVARALREEAADAFTKGDYATCRAKAQAALNVGKEPQTVGLLGMCEAGDHSWVSAAEHLDYAIQFDPSAERKTHYEAKLTEAKTHVGVVPVTTKPANVAIRLDDKDEGDAPKTLFVSPGHYVVKLEKEGFKTNRIEIDVVAGAQRPVDANLEPSSGGREQGKPVWPTVLLAGVGAIGLGVGVGLEVAASAKLAPVDGIPCPAGEVSCPQRLKDATSAHNALDAGGVASFAVGGAALVGMVIYLVLPAPSAGQAPHTSIYPIVGPRAQGLGFSTRF